MTQARKEKKERKKEIKKKHDSEAIFELLVH